MKLSPGHPQNIPDFLVIGAAKSGTTSLFFYLAQHPEIFVPRTFKEPGFLCFAGRQATAKNPAAPFPDMWSGVISDLTDYTALFDPATAGQRVGEATPEYLYLHNATIHNIRATYRQRANSLKFIVVLRNPIARIWSHYWMFVRDGYETLPFEIATADSTIQKRLSAGWHPSYDYRGFGNYAAQVAAWQDAFGGDSLKIILADDLSRSAGAVCREMYAHIGVADDFVPDTSTTYNVSGRLRNEWLHELLLRRQYGLKSLMRRVVPQKALQSLKQRLLIWNTEKLPMPDDVKVQFLDFYRGDVEALQHRIGRNLDAWLR
ncbi:sulfotransferase [Bradyrhizobium sp. WSM471]|uniref:sulfotransferase n=1 Tax=Bradyrhizobium sp. WSM471 TaxID=319017 RepID=UPI00024D2C25|nr:MULTISPECIES: sulfotransferase [Bradyrhizobium]EHR04624.1 hypothetical protein Bra471DRAFT_05427 [Bradyrhizobium sp. WSM471]UFW39772.1 sulfotransferase [Bradyrhizobium canariense]